MQYTDDRYHWRVEIDIDPSFKMLLRNPEREKENASLARTWRETPFERR
jgi:hypothetical protein